MPDPEHTRRRDGARARSATCSCRSRASRCGAMLNMARGAYWSELGNTPGHLNHWSKRSFVRLLSQHGEVVEVRSPFPWTMLLVRALTASRPPRADAPRQPPAGAVAGVVRRPGARILSIGIASTGLFTFAYFALASHVLDAAPRTARDRLLWSVMFVIISVIYRPIEQLLSRTIADRRARGLRRAIRCACRRRSRSASRSLFLVVALALRPTDRAATCSTARRRCTGSSSSACSPTPAATSRAAGSPGHQRFGALRRARVARVDLALPVRARGRRSGSRRGQTAVALGMAAAPFVSLSSCRSRSPRARPRRAVGRRARGADARRGAEGPAHAEVEEAATRPLAAPRRALRGRRSSAIMLAEQTLLNAGVLIVDATSGRRARRASSSTCC